MREPACVGALIRDDRGRVFVQRRSATRRVLPGIWDIVGGHIEAGETIEATLAREIHEDLAAPRLEADKHDAYAWVGRDTLDLMMEGRTDGDRRLRDIVAAAIDAQPLT